VRPPRPLDALEIRVLGCLMEKEKTTPEYYPLTLNALVAACNQKSNRDPVMELTDVDVQGALDRLREHVLVWATSSARTERWEHRLDRRLELDAAGKAILTVLFLRGLQTPGELRARTERLHPFASIADVEATLRSLAGGEEPLVVELPRQPGHKEARWTHLAGGEPAPVLVDGLVAGPPPGTLAERVERLEHRIDELLAELSELKDRLGE
jgi:uncharacterized protein YceH (UPF0502 family)